MAIGGPDELVELLTNTPVILRQLTEDMDVDATQQRDPNGWSTREIVGHLIDVELRAVDRLELILAEDNPTVDGYDPNEMVSRQKYQEQNLNDLVVMFAGLRAERLEGLKALDDADWQRGCTSSDGVPMTLFEINTHSCNHDVSHLAQIAWLQQSLEN
jgi:uncharacterized damage-inducible protein DinB